MDFNEEFVLLQGSLLSLEKSVGDLKCLTVFEGDDTKIAMVVDSIKRFIAGRGIKLEDKSIDVKQNQTLRRMLMFLILNTNLDIQEKLMDDINCGHIVDCAPNLSKELLVELVDKLSLCSLMCEIIIYVPLSFGIELLDSMLIKLNCMESFQALPWIVDLARAVYTKYMIQETSGKCGQSKLLAYFRKLLQYFVNPNVKSLANISAKELYRYAGFAVKSILSLIIDCVKLNLSPSEHASNAPDIYNITLPEYYDKNEKQVVSSTDLITELLTVCKINCQSITIDIWLFWSECEIEMKEVTTKSLQSIIAEAMFNVRELLMKLQNIKNLAPVGEDIISMFSSMAVKPRDEDDEIKEADIKLIIQNVLDNTKSQKKWFRALIEHVDVMTNVDCISCLEKCLGLADSEDVKVIIEKCMMVLGSNSSDENNNRIKNIIFDMIKRLPLDQQVDIVEWYFEKFGIGTKLMKENFQGVITEVFNKAVKTSHNKEKFVSECILLCLQSPVDVVTKVLHEALINAKQISLMINILKHLKCVCSMHYSEEDVSPSLTLVAYLMDKIMHQNLSDVENSNFVNFIVAMTNHNILNGCVFVTKCLLPALHRSICARTWPLVLLWLQTLQVFINGTANVAIDVLFCPILVMLAQVVEESRWNVLTYSSSVALVSEEALVALKTILAAFLDNKIEEDKEVKWLQFKLEQVSSPLNKSYFNKVWSKFGRNWTSLPYSIDLFLLDVIQSDEFIEDNNVKVTQLFQHMGSKENALLFSLSKLLPLCTTSEWTVLASRLKQIEKLYVDVPYIHLFSDSVLLLITVLKKKALLENDSVLLCLDYCVRNLGLVTKEKIIPEVTSRKEKLKVFTKVVHILGSLPPASRESCSILVINVLVELMQGMFNDKTTGKEKSYYLKDMVTNIGVLENGEPLQVLARKMVDCLVVHDE